MTNSAILIYCIAFASIAAAFVFAFCLYLWVKKQPEGNETIRQVAVLMKSGANTFMRNSAS